MFKSDHSSKHRVTLRTNIKKYYGVDPILGANPHDAINGKGVSTILNWDITSSPPIYTIMNGALTDVNIMPLDIGLGHELIHVDHYQNGSLYSKINSEGKFIMPKDYHTYPIKDALGIIRIDGRDARIEELRTVGLAGYNKKTDITENHLRSEHNLYPRGAY